MTSLSETALTFAKECMGWSDAEIVDFPRRIHSYKRHRKFDYYDLNAVMKAARTWWQSAGGEKAFRFGIELGDNLNIVSINRPDEGADIAGIATAPCDDLCFGLMAACLEAARKLKEHAA